MKGIRPLLLIVMAVIVSCYGEKPSLRLATTTSVENSGLLQGLLSEFEDEEGIDVDALAVGSGKAMGLVRRGDADLMITHDPAGERGFIDGQSPLLYRKVMCGDFLLVGPPGDPASVAGAGSATDAMERIASSDAPFVSRGDRSGTHVREAEIWKASTTRPDPSRLLETGQGMASTLRIASERAGYTLTDLATFLQLRESLDLVPLYDADDSLLLNCYAITVATGPKQDTALRFAEWLTRGRGRDLIEEFQIGGRRVFRLWPEDVPDHLPELRPQ